MPRAWRRLLRRRRPKGAHNLQRRLAHLTVVLFQRLLPTPAVPRAACSWPAWPSWPPTRRPAARPHRPRPPAQPPPQARPRRQMPTAKRSRATLQKRRRSWAGRRTARPAPRPTRSRRRRRPRPARRPRAARRPRRMPPMFSAQATHAAPHRGGAAAAPSVCGDAAAVGGVGVEEVGTGSGEGGGTGAASPLRDGAPSAARAEAQGAGDSGFCAAGR